MFTYNFQYTEKRLIQLTAISSQKWNDLDFFLSLFLFLFQKNITTWAMNKQITIYIFLETNQTNQSVFLCWIPFRLQICGFLSSAVNYTFWSLHYSCRRCSGIFILKFQNVITLLLNKLIFAHHEFIMSGMMFVYSTLEEIKRKTEKYHTLFINLHSNNFNFQF